MDYIYNHDITFTDKGTNRLAIEMVNCIIHNKYLRDGNNRSSFDDNNTISHIMRYDMVSFVNEVFGNGHIYEEGFINFFESMIATIIQRINDNRNVMHRVYLAMAHLMSKILKCAGYTDYVIRLMEKFAHSTYNKGGVNGLKVSLLINSRTFIGLMYDIIIDTQLATYIEVTDLYSKYGYIYDFSNNFKQFIFSKTNILIKYPSTVDKDTILLLLLIAKSKKYKRVCGFKRLTCLAIGHLCL